MASDTLLLEACHVARHRPDGPGWLLEDISLQIRGGQRLAIVGPSGSGKTLLLRALALLDPLDRGEIRWGGRAVREQQVPSFRREVLYLHQRPALWGETVEEAIRVPFSLAAYRGRSFDRQRVVQWLRAMGRDPSFLQKPVRDLSGGERQITNLVRAIQLDPRLLLLDEPTAALDRQTTRAVEGLLDRWVAESADSRGLVWVSHDAGQARRVAERILSVQAGHLVGDDDDAAD